MTKSFNKPYLISIKTLEISAFVFVVRFGASPSSPSEVKCFITIALDVANQSLDGPGTPFEAHVKMALKQGVSFEEIEEILLFTCAYSGFNKAGGAFGKLNEIRSRT